jgi:hypothetical protein
VPHQPTAPPGKRFFARIDRFHCECPACGHLLIARSDSARAFKDRLYRSATLYNPVLSRVRCPGCHTVYGVGLLLWPSPAGRPKLGEIPLDHRPTRRQLATLRQYAYGIWAREPKRQGDELNVALDQECTCPQVEGGWAPGCPVHGWEQVEAFNREQAALLEAEDTTQEIDEDEENE